MTYEEFREKIIADLEEYYGSDAEIKLRKVNKNNGFIYEGINICFSDDTNIVPVIYLESIYKLYENGASIDECVGKIIQIRENTQDCPICLELNPVEIITEWKNAKKYIIPILVSTIKNKDILNGYAHQEFLDLSIIYAIRFKSELTGGTMSAKITKSLFEGYGVSLAELHESAMDNLMKDEYKLLDMEQVLSQKIGVIEDEEMEKCLSLAAHNMYVLTNQNNMYGAAGILNQDFLKSRSNGRSFYVIPSSVHEMIFVLAEPNVNVDYLNSIIKEVNEGQIDETEVLSDHAYYYDGKTGEFSIAG
ncbi:MAG: DUF5688 family protein [Lachnospiraceae bacterium]|nr:DUF5688 family protein [Lachnospiraceae bacterium]